MPGFFIRGKPAAAGNKRKVNTFKFTPPNKKQKPEKAKPAEDEVIDSDDLSGGGLSDDEILRAGDDSTDDENDSHIERSKQFLREEFERREQERLGVEEKGAASVDKLFKKIAETVSLENFGLNVRRFRGHRLSPTSLCLANDTSIAFSCSKDGGIIKWDMETGVRLAVLKSTSKTQPNCGKSLNGTSTSLALSSNDKILCSGSTDNNIYLWDKNSMQLIKKLMGHRSAVSGVAVRKNNNQLFSCSYDRSVKVWDLNQMGYMDTLFGHTDRIMGIDCLNRERAVTCGGLDRTIRLFKIAEESQLIFNGHSECGSIDCVRLINEDHFVSGSADGSLSIWSTFKKKPLSIVNSAHSLPGDCWITSVASNRYTNFLTSGASDGNLKFWRIGDDFKSLRHLYSHPVEGFINDLQFSNDGSLLVAAIGQEHKAGLWFKNKKATNSLLVLPIRYDEKMIPN